VADSKVSALSEISVPALDDELYIVDDPDGSPVSNAVKTRRLLGQALRGICGFRLTTETGVGVSSSDRASQGTIYATPYGPDAGLITLYDGTRWRLYDNAEVSLALTATSGNNYDVFMYDNSGTLTLELSAAWTNDTTRANALGTVNNITVGGGTPANTRRWLGVIRASGANVTEDSAGGSTTQVGGKRYVWNAYNQVRRDLKVIDTTNSWTYTTNTIRQANAASGNKVEYVTGDAASFIEANIHGVIYLEQNSVNAAKVGVGIDSTTTFSGLVQGGYNQDTTGLGGAPAGIYAPIFGTYSGQPGLGYHALNWNEKGADGSSIFLGDNGGDSQQSGLRAWILG
jgi:hypothetical protein